MKRLKILFSFTWVVCMGIDLLYSQCDASFDISNTSVCAQQSVTFTGTNNGSNQSFEWEFSGVGNRIGRRVELSFPARDNAYEVEVTLNVRDEDGNECSTTQTINIQATPRIEGELINTQRCLDAASPIDTFSTGVRITSPIPGELTWNWGDGSGPFPSDQAVLGHTYNQYGSFPVEISFDNGQCVGYYRDTVRFYKRPSVDIQLPVGGTDLCEGEKVNVVNSTDSSVVDYYVWNWGDGNTNIVNNNSTPEFTYNLSGRGNCAENSEEYTIEVRAFNSCVDKNTHRGTIDIFVSPTVVAEIGINDTVRCVGESISFSNLTCPENDQLQFEWNFGDGSTSTEITPNHVYTNPGVYEVTLGL